MGRRKLFCERGPLCYAVSLRKEYLLRWCRDLGSHVRFASSQTGEPLPFIVKSHRSVLLRKLFGGFLIIIGIIELFKKQKKEDAPAKQER